jgi:hypothetical protein
LDICAKSSHAQKPQADNLKMLYLGDLANVLDVSCILGFRISIEPILKTIQALCHWTYYLSLRPILQASWLMVELIFSF